MSRSIAVWGSPGSGKTSFAVKLACAIYEQYNAVVLLLSADMITPSLPVLFPHRKAYELPSVGVPLSRTEITPDEVIRSVVTVKDKMNFGVLGFRDSENKYSYPTFDSIKANELITVLQSLAHIVIVDCTSEMDELSQAAVQRADTVLRLATPDLKSVSFFASQLSVYADAAYKCEQHIVGLNVTDNDVFMPLEDTKAHFGGVSFTLPYCREIKQQMLDGELCRRVSDKKHNAKMKKIISNIM